MTEQVQQAASLFNVTVPIISNTVRAGTVSVPAGGNIPLKNNSIMGSAWTRLKVRTAAVAAGDLVIASTTTGDGWQLVTAEQVYIQGSVGRTTTGFVGTDLFLRNTTGAAIVVEYLAGDHR